MTWAVKLIKGTEYGVLRIKQIISLRTKESGAKCCTIGYLALTCEVPRYIVHAAIYHLKVCTRDTKIVARKKNVSYQVQVSLTYRSVLLPQLGGITFAQLSCLYHNVLDNPTTKN